MKRTMATAGLALLVSATTAMAADFGKTESGKGRERVAREWRFGWHEARGARDCAGHRSHHSVRLFTEYGDERCKVRRALRPTPIWRGYPQAR